MNSADFIAISRHRMGTDGQGITTLVAFFGCPLRCRYCINPSSFSEGAHRERLSPSELYDRLKCDDLYFRATGGGVTFGGGEPLCNIAFLEEFAEINKRQWRMTAETSLSVPEDSVVRAAAIFDEFVVDIKDTNPEIYKLYTSRDGSLALSNLKLLSSLVNTSKILVRLPLIKGFNDNSDRDKSESLLRSIGITRFDKFTYRVRE